MESQKRYRKSDFLKDYSCTVVSIQLVRHAIFFRTNFVDPIAGHVDILVDAVALLMLQEFVCRNNNK